MGLSHFLNHNFFLKMMPRYIPFKVSLIFITGFLEVLFGLLLLIEETRFYAAWGIIVLLILLFQANLYIAFDTDAQNEIGMSSFAARLRLLLQVPLVFIAYWHSII